MFPDSHISKPYQCAKTKTYCLLNGALAPGFHKDFVLKMKSGPYRPTLATNGSNESDLTKMNPFTMKIIDSNCNTVTSNCLDMCNIQKAKLKQFST